MVTIFRKNNKLIYESKSGLMNKKEITKAEKIYKDLTTKLSRIENKLSKEKSALKKWHLVGNVLKKLVRKYRLEELNEYGTFWISIYDYVPKLLQKNIIPKRSMNWKQNHFYQCMQMSKYNWKTVVSVGNWSIWREMFDNKKIIEDNRILSWVIEKLKKFKKYKLGHKDIRPFLYAISNRLKKIDTSVLTQEELYYKLDQINFRIDSLNKKIEFVTENLTKKKS